jgi:RNase adaptor protein for sRNA GlmZ degradation
MSKKSKKLGVIVPYRNRPEQLELFKKRITKYLNRHSIPFELIIVNQDDAKLFNRGMLLNIGFKYAEELDCDYVVFHDIDMIPLHVDYSYSDFPVHLATGFKENKDENEELSEHLV